MIQKDFIEYSWIIFMKNIEDCNSHKKRKILIAFDDMIVHMLSNKQN